jgi:hypothetical protein
MKPRREKTVSVRLTNDEYKLLGKIAESQNVDNSDVLRMPLITASSGLSEKELLESALDELRALRLQYLGMGREKESAIAKSDEVAA